MSQGTQQSQAAAPAMAAPQPKVQRAERAVEKDVAVEQSDASAAFPRLGDPILRLQRAIGNQAVGRLVEPAGARYRIQPKLHINAPNDIYEQEADRVADTVMRDAHTEHMPAAHAAPQTVSRLQTAPSPGAPSSGARSAVQTPCPACEDEERKRLQRKPAPDTGGVVVQRKCAECEKKELQRKPIAGNTAAGGPTAGIVVSRAPFAPEIQRETGDSDEDMLAIAPEAEEKTTVSAKRRDGGEGQDSSGLESQLASTRGGGMPLPPEARGFFEDRMGADFSGVRVHADARSAAMAQSINARAFTHGSDVYFGAGEYAPGSHDGGRLLAHELTHTLQQGGAVGRVQRADPPGGAPAGGTDAPKKPAVLLTPYPVKVGGRDIKNAKHFLVTSVQQVIGLQSEEDSAAFIDLLNLHWIDSTYGGPAPDKLNVTVKVGFEKSLVDMYRKQARGLEDQPGGITKAAWDKRREKAKKGNAAYDLPGGPEPGSGMARLQFVPSMAIVQDDRGAELRPDANTKGGPLLPLNTRMITIKEQGSFYFVSLEDGQLGYVEKTKVDTMLPEPKAQLHRIKSGETATHIVKKYYGGFNTWGADQRLYVNVLLYVNKQTGRDGIVGYDYQSAYTYAGKQIWIPSQDFATYLRGRKDVSSGSLSYDVYQRFLDVAVGTPVFIAGVLHGALESLWDLLVGLVDLLGMAWDILKGIFTGTIGKQASDLFAKLDKLDLAELAKYGLEKLDQQWNDGDLLKRWHFRGWLVGYAVMEVIMLFFTDGAIEAVKAASKSAEVAKFVKAIPLLNDALEAAKALKAEGKAAQLIDAIKANKQIAGALEKLQELRSWASKTLKLTQRTIMDLSLDALEWLKTIPAWAQEEISKLGEAACRLLLGCASPCAVNPKAIWRRLERVVEMANGTLVRGFRNAGEVVERFGNLRNGILRVLGESKFGKAVDDVVVGLRGSSVTGVSSKGGGFRWLNQVGAAGASDVDFFFTSKKLEDILIRRGAIFKNGEVMHLEEMVKYAPELVTELEKFGADTTKLLGRKGSALMLKQSYFASLSPAEYVLYIR